MSLEEIHVPDGWVASPLGQVIQPRGEKVRPSEDPEAKFIGMKHVESHSTKILGSIPAASMKSDAVRFLRGDVLYGRLGPYQNKVAQPDFDGLASAEFIVFPDTSLVDSCFLKHRLNATDFVSFASHLSKGDRPRVNFGQISAFTILIPPPREQCRIVAKIEELFSELNKGIESLKKARSQLGVYRQAVLKHAFEGNLTEGWRAEHAAEIESADALLARIREEREVLYQQQTPYEIEGGMSSNSPNDLPEGWALSDLSGITELNPRFEKSVPNDNLVVSFVPMSSVASTGAIDVSQTRPLEDVKKGYTPFREGDVLFAKITPCMENGKVAIARSLENGLGFGSTEFHVMRPLCEIDASYVYYFVSSEQFRRNAQHNMTGAVGQRRVPASYLANQSIPVPPVGEQARIVDLLDGLFFELDQNEKEIDAVLNRVETLRQSILKKAFSGQLVPQDPNDEPASVLLERIKAEKVAQVRTDTTAKSRNRTRATA